jgi:hypothetical protein
LTQEHLLTTEETADNTFSQEELHQGWNPFKVVLLYHHHFFLPLSRRGCNSFPFCKSIVLKVRGLIYHGDFHFTSRIVGTDGIVWYHDGMTTGSTCKNEGGFDEFSNKDIMNSEGKVLTMVVYARV